ncbi:MAG: HAD family hydrolase [Paracoccaceae bacterium]
MAIQGLIFDKDGTLFDFQQSWGGWFARLLDSLSDGQAERRAALAQRMDFDLATQRFNPNSIFIAGTSDDMIAHIADLMPHETPQNLLARIAAMKAEPAQVPALPLAPYLSALRARGLVLAVATNDGEGPARAQLKIAGIHDQFACIAGYDSGFGAKPAPGMLLGVAEKMGLAPHNLAMVGDSTHDMHAGRAAGMHCIAVLTGPATQADLHGHADIVLGNIGEIPEYLSKTT